METILSLEHFSKLYRNGRGAKNISFPVDEFFPPNSLNTPCDYEGTKQYCNCRK